MNYELKEKEMLQKAKETGEKQIVYREIKECKIPGTNSDFAEVTLYALPDGRLKQIRKPHDKVVLVQRNYLEDDGSRAGYSKVFIDTQDNRQHYIDTRNEDEFDQYITDVLTIEGARLLVENLVKDEEEIEVIDRILEKEITSLLNDDDINFLNEQLHEFYEAKNSRLVGQSQSNFYAYSKCLFNNKILNRNQYNYLVKYIERAELILR